MTGIVDAGGFGWLAGASDAAGASPRLRTSPPLRLKMRARDAADRAIHDGAMAGHVDAAALPAVVATP